MYKNVYGYISPFVLLSVWPQKVTRIFLIFLKCGYHLYLILKESKSANHIIFHDYLTGMKIIVPENFDFQYFKNFLCIRFFVIGLKIGTDPYKHIISKLAYRISEFPYGTKMTSKYKWKKKKNSLIFWCKKSISSQVLAQSQKSDAQKTLLLLCLFLFNI